MSTFNSLLQSNRFIFTCILSLLLHLFADISFCTYILSWPETSSSQPSKSTVQFSATSWAALATATALLIQCVLTEMNQSCQMKCLIHPFPSLCMSATMLRHLTIFNQERYLNWFWSLEVQFRWQVESLIKELPNCFLGTCILILAFVGFQSTQLLRT